MTPFQFFVYISAHRTIRKKLGGYLCPLLFVFFSLLALALVSVKAYATPFVLNVTTSNGTLTGTIDIDTVAGVATGANLLYSGGSLTRTITSAPVSQGPEPFSSTYGVNHIYDINFSDTGIQLHLSFYGSSLKSFTGAPFICTTQYFCLIQARPFVEQAISTLTLDVGADSIQSGTLLPGGPDPVTLTPGPVAFTMPILVNLTGSANTSIYYTLDGTAPSSASTRYTAPIPISATTTLSAFQQIDSLPAYPSAITTATYTYIPHPPQPAPLTPPTSS